MYTRSFQDLTKALFSHEGLPYQCLLEFTTHTHTFILDNRDIPLENTVAGQGMNHDAEAGAHGEVVADNASLLDNYLHILTIFP